MERAERPTPVAPPLTTPPPPFAGFQLPQIARPQQARVPTQQELIESAKAKSPPGVRDIISGRRPANARFALGGSQWGIPTWLQLQMLTPDEREALKTRLAIENVSLTDLMQSVGDRFAPTGTRRARYFGSR